jgi:hypothetical protein
MTLYEAIRLWADGQNSLNATAADRGELIQSAVEQALNRLHRYGSLADLAAAYVASDSWWARVAEEFGLDPAEALVVRDAAHWQRFMEIRHPATRTDRVR